MNINSIAQDATVVWEKVYGGESDDFVNSIQFTSDGGCILVGWTKSNDGDISDGNNGYSDFWILKLNEDGIIQWDKTYGGSNYDKASSIQTTVDGGYIVAGVTTSNDGDISDGNNGDGDFWVLKLDINGNKIWDKTYGGLNNDEASSIQTMIDGGYIVTGYTESFDNDISDGNNGARDVWVLKINSDGVKQWDKTYGGSNNDEASSIQTTIDGGYIVAGITESNDGDITNGNSGMWDSWILKLDSVGTKQWDETYGGEYGDRFYSIQTNDNGECVAVGIKGNNDNYLPDFNVWAIKLSLSNSIKKILHKRTYIFPNPAKEYILITNKTSKEINIEIVDISGKVCQTGALVRESKIDISHLESGIYFVKVGEQAQKLIIE